MVKKLLIFGGSGHAKDVHSTARSIGYESFEFVTSDGSCAVHGYRAQSEADFNASAYADWDCIVAIGNNGHRKGFHERYPQLRFANIISSTAVVSSGALLGVGIFVGAFTYIGPDTKIGDGAIINTHAVIGHDVEVGKFSHICPRVCIAGHVTLDAHCFVGAAAVFNNGTPAQPLHVPNGTHVGMGCLVTESIKHTNTRLIPKPNSMAVRSDA